jgi:hypothetical protein
MNYEILVEIYAPFRVLGNEEVFRKTGSRLHLLIGVQPLS